MPTTEPINGSTFRSIDLRFEAWPQDDYRKFVAALRADVTRVKEERRRWYADLQRRYQWITRVRHWMVLCTIMAASATTCSTIARLFEKKLPVWWEQPVDVWLLILALLLFAAVAALGLYERYEEGSGHYFRSVMNILQIRDAWTDYQFKDAVLSLEPDPAGAAALMAMKSRWLTLAQTFVVALDKQATTELNEWHTAFSTALKDMTDNAAASLKATQQAIESIVTKRIEEAFKAAEEAKAAARPGTAEVTISDVSPELEAKVLLDGAVVRSGRGRTFVVPNVPQGRHTIRVEMAPAGDTPGKSAETAKDFTAAILPITLKPV